MTEPDKPQRGPRWGQPKKKYVRKLKVGTSYETWQPLVDVAVFSVLSKHNDVLIAFSYLFQFPLDFPKGVLHEQIGYDDVRRIKAEKLLQWLYEQGYTEHSPRSVINARMKFTRKFTDMENMFDSFL